MERQGAASPNRRHLRNILLDRRYQLRNALLLFLLLLIHAAILGFFLFFPALKDLATTAHTLEHYEAAVFFDRLYRVFFWAIVLADLVIVAYSFVLMHRIVGPIYRFRETCERMSKGQFDFQVQLRRRDWFKDLAAGFNQTLLSVDAKVEEAQRGMADLEALLDKAYEQSEEGRVPSAHLDQIRERARSVRETLSWFHSPLPSPSLRSIHGMNRQSDERPNNQEYA